MKILILSLIFTFSCAAAAAAQNKSVYTSTKTNACRTIRSTSEGTGSYVGECPGVGGYKVRLIEGDLRQTLDIITPARKKFELKFWNIFGSFSSIGEKVEWRMKGRAPVALISRYNVADPEDSRKNTSYLFVSKIGRSMSCVTDVVEPGPGQNEKARRLADVSSGKPCKIAD
jgi:hypothetical protein